MVELAGEAYSVLKQVDSTVLVVSPAAVGEGGLRWLDQYLALGGAKYLDVVGFHFYAVSSSPEAMLPMIAKVRQIKSEHRVDNRPLWNTETGWVIASASAPVNPKSGGFAADTKVLSQDDAAAYVARALILGWTAGLGRFYWYSWDHLAMGLVEPDGTLKKAGRAYEEVEHWLVGTDLRCADPDAQGTWICRVGKANTVEGIIAWNPRETVAVPVPNDWRSISVRGVDGSLNSVTGGGRISVGISPVLIEPDSLAN